MRRGGEEEKGRRRESGGQEDEGARAVFAHTQIQARAHTVVHSDKRKDRETESESDVYTTRLVRSRRQRSTCEWHYVLLCVARCC